MRTILLVIDMQNDFLTGSLATKEAQALVPQILKKIKTFKPEDVFATRDTHKDNYLDTQEGKLLPVKHCLINTEGWLIEKSLSAALAKSKIYNKPTFASLQLADEIRKIHQRDQLTIEICGVCSDICVIANAFLLKSYLPEVPIIVDEALVAGTTPEKNKEALDVMKSCQIIIQ